MLWHLNFAARYVQPERMAATNPTLGEQGLDMSESTNKISPAVIQDRCCQLKIVVVEGFCNSTQHSMIVIAEHGSTTGYKHLEQFAIGGVAGKIYRYNFKIEDENASNDQPVVETQKSDEKWILTGLMD
jgi:hypothetical protein